MKVVVCTDYDEMSKQAAQVFADHIQAKPDIVLGLATGGTPEGMYAELVRMHKQEGLDFSRVRTFNLDEYVGLEPTHDQSYRCFMNTTLFDQTNIKKENTRVPDGLAGDLEKQCLEYEEAIKAAGGIDLQLLGIGVNGHIAFNEPGGTRDSRTRVVELDESTRQANSRFFNSIDEVPTHALSMGIGTILEAREIVLLAGGENKADAIAQTLEGPATAQVPASLLRDHPNVTFIIDKAAASKLKGSH
jgi:glucosamine-6-phosphate deaminase